MLFTVLSTGTLFKLLLTWTAMIRLKAVVNGRELSKWPFNSWAATLDALEQKHLKVLSYSADPTPEVDRHGIVIKVRFEVVREAGLVSPPGSPLAPLRPPC